MGPSDKPNKPHLSRHGLPRNELLVVWASRTTGKGAVTGILDESAAGSGILRGRKIRGVMCKKRERYGC